MAESMPAPPQSKMAPWLKYFGFFMLAVGFVSICLLIGSFAFLAAKIVPVIAPMFGGVPQLSGTLTDAITGQPVAGMDVCLIARSRGIGGLDVERSEVKQSDATGKFSFEPSKQKGFGAAGYEIGITDPAAQLSFSCGMYRDLLTNPGFVQGSTLPFSHERKVFYFPVAMIEGLPNDPNDHTQYGPMFQKFTNPANIQIALIPLLPDDSGCDAIQDQTHVGFCRWLNNSGDAAILRKKIRESPNHH